MFLNVWGWGNLGMGLQVPQEHTEGTLPPPQPPEASALQATLPQPWGEGKDLWKSIGLVKRYPA